MNSLSVRFNLNFDRDPISNPLLWALAGRFALCKGCHWACNWHSQVDMQVSTKLSDTAYSDQSARQSPSTRFFQSVSIRLKASTLRNPIHSDFSRCDLLGRDQNSPGFTLSVQTLNFKVRSLANQFGHQIPKHSNAFYKVFKVWSSQHVDVPFHTMPYRHRRFFL